MRIVFTIEIRVMLYTFIGIYSIINEHYIILSAFYTIILVAVNRVHNIIGRLSYIIEIFIQIYWSLMFY